MRLGKLRCALVELRKDQSEQLQPRTCQPDSPAAHHHVPDGVVDEEQVAEVQGKGVVEEVDHEPEPELGLVVSHCPEQQDSASCDSAKGIDMLRSNTSAL